LIVWRASPLVENVCTTWDGFLDAHYWLSSPSAKGLRNLTAAGNDSIQRKEISLIVAKAMPLVLNFCTTRTVSWTLIIG